MKINIVFRFRSGPWGGGNQFLRALRDVLASTGQLALNFSDADLILFDSFNDIDQVISAKQKHPTIPFVHRVNGPISAYRGRGEHVDRLIYSLTRHVANGVIFQSEYSKRANQELGMDLTNNVVIHNAADPIFFSTYRPSVEREGRIKIISTSWSTNLNKGFNTLKYLDDNLDFSRFEMTFVGSSPIEFKNITMIPPQDSASLAAHLSQHDIYFSGSKNEPCSNAVLEALAVGLPVVALKSGGTPELVGSAGEYFHNSESATEAIDKVSRDIEKYQSRIRSRRIETACAEYLSFFEEVLALRQPPKKLTVKGLIDIQSKRLLRKIHLGVDKFGRVVGTS